MLHIFSIQLNEDILKNGGHGQRGSVLNSDETTIDFAPPNIHKPNKGYPFVLAVTLMNYTVIAHTQQFLLLMQNISS